MAESWGSLAVAESRSRIADGFNALWSSNRGAVEPTSEDPEEEGNEETRAEAETREFSM